MADIMDMSIPLGQGPGVREIRRAKDQTLKHHRPPLGRTPQEKEEKKKEPCQGFADNQESQDCNAEADKDQSAKASQLLGSILDVTI